VKNSYRFFSNIECKYFPCHKTSRPEKFNCLFCYCPLYFFEECGGNFRMLESGVKDCTTCLIPHTYEGYDHIVGKLKERFVEIRSECSPEK